METVPPAQTLEELKRERELKRLRAEQERLMEQQEAADRVLLRSFRSVDDLIMARDGKLASIDVVIGVARGNIRRQQERLAQLRSEAADLERAGKPIPQHLEERHRQDRAVDPRGLYATIVDREQQKEEIRRGLRPGPQALPPAQGHPGGQGRALRGAEPAGPAQPGDLRPAGSNATGSGPGPCAYVREHATTPVQTAGLNILITAPPKSREDLSLTLSLIQDKARNPPPCSSTCSARTRDRRCWTARARSAGPDGVPTRYGIPRRAVADP